MLIIAHRGSSGAAPENTLLAFRRAVRDGADMIELDVRLSADGEPVVFHDRSLRRVTGRAGSVRKQRAADLERIPVRAPGGRPEAQATIPRLATVLQVVPRTMGLNIEVKTDGDRRRSPLLAKRLGGLLRSAGRRRILLSSFDHGFLRRFHRGHPRVALGALYAAGRDHGHPPALLARRTGASVFICSNVQLQAGWIPPLHAASLALLVYGVERAAELRTLRRMGADGIITNFPARMRRALTSPC